MNSLKQLIFNNISTQHGLLIDTHAHIGMSLSSYVKGGEHFCQSLEELKLKMDLFGVDYSFIFPFPELDGNTIGNIYYDAKHGYFDKEEFPYQLSNTYMFSNVINNGYQSFLPFMIIDPKNQLDKQLSLFEKYKEYTFGFKIHTTSNEISPINIPFELIELCEYYRMPIIFHTRACQKQYNCWSVLELAEKNPDVNVCVAHCAGFDQDFFKELNNVNNVYFDVSPLLSLCHLAKIGNEKVISQNRFDWDYSDCYNVFLKLYSIAPTHILWATDEPCGLNIQDKYQLQVGVLKNSEEPIIFQIQSNVLKFLSGNRNESV